MAPAYARTVRSAVRRPTARWRALPDFLVIGAMKGGTTSLFRYLSDNPLVIPAVRKEVRYFDVNYERGELWYRSMFPTRRALSRGDGRRRLTGEASPGYLAHPDAPARCAALLPDVRLLVLLRDPVERAFSHWKHKSSAGVERLTVAEALAAERGDRPPDNTAGAVGLPYVSRGLYADQLGRWLEHFPREQLLVQTSESLFLRPQPTYGRVLDFLGLTAQPVEFARHNAGVDDTLDHVARAELAEVFVEPNARLADLLGWTEDPWKRLSSGRAD